MPMLVNNAALEIIKRRETLQLVAYLCPGRVPTAGWGHTKGITMDDVRSKRRFAVATCQKWLREDTAEAAAAVEKLLKVPTSENEFGALVSLAFNIGADALRKSTVLRLHNAGDKAGAAKAFSMWNKDRNADGVLVELRGLTLRRAEEAALYLTPTAEMEAADPIRTRGNTTEAAPPPPPAGSAKAALGYAAAGGSAVVGLVKEAAPAVSEALPALQLVAQYAPWAIGALVLGAAAFYLWARWEARQAAG